MQSWSFSIITPVYSVTWSFRNHADLLQEMYIIIIIINYIVEMEMTENKNNDS